MSTQSLNWTIAAITYSLPQHNYEAVVDWRGDGDEIRPYSERVDDIVSVATTLDPMLLQYGVHGDESIDSYITIDRVVSHMVANYRNTRSYRMSSLEVRTCLAWYDSESRIIVDPNDVLKDIRQLVTSLQDGQPQRRSPGKTMEVAEELAEKFHNLDQWIVSGGFLPDDWKDKIVKYAPLRPPEDRHPTHLEISPTMFCVMLAEKLGSVRYAELEGLFSTTPSLVSSWLWWYEQAAIAVDQHARSYELIGDDPDRFWDKYALDVVATHLKKATELPRNVAELLDVAIARALKDKDAESAS